MKDPRPLIAAAVAAFGLRLITLAGELALDCGQISPEEGAELAKNRAAAKAQSAGQSPNP